MSNEFKTCCPGGDCTFDRARPELGCLDCGLGICHGCDARLDPADLAEVAWVPGEYAPGTLCAGCVVGDTDGVPDAVEEEETSAQTVRERTPSDAELVALIEQRRAA